MCVYFEETKVELKSGLCKLTGGWSPHGSSSGS